VWLFDTPSLALLRQGVRLRLRERGRQAELTLKVAGQDCRIVAQSLLQSEGKCESDLHGNSLDDVVSLTSRVDSSAFRSLTDGPEKGPALARTLESVLSRSQSSQLAAHSAGGAAAPLPPDIVRLGPSTVNRLTSQSLPYVIEAWTLQGGQQFVELSQKVPREEALARRDELERLLAAQAVTVCSDQASKAREKQEQLAR